MRIKSGWEVIKGTVARFSDDHVTTLGAAVAYYAIFSIAPILVIIVGVVGLVFGEGSARHEMLDQLKSAVGPRSAAVIESMMSSQTREGSLIATIIGIVALLLGASGVFGQLKMSLNLIWHVQPKPGRAVPGLIMDRLVSLVVLMGIGILLIVSLVLSTAVTAFYHYIEQNIQIPGSFARLVQLLVSGFVLTMLFAMLFKLLPDVRIGWRNLWVGSITTALLFLLGEYLLSLYLGRQGTASPYGAAGSVVLILMWIYYSSLIVLIGAEFTQAYVRQTGASVEPGKYAEWMTAAPALG
ncbi:MAG TPA: YihY/virulence factor BrkB family protein [Candidatus Limnocylindrales bacterium]|jgi:membrane protein|nr:YihY/virulence factor BrkB family protein [Candidatus Limnocylindrales bacterium]